MARMTPHTPHTRHTRHTRHDDSPPKGREDIFAALFAVIEARRQADPGRSYVASLLAGGPPAIGRKVVEEAGEFVEAAVAGHGPGAVVHECCDLLFHSFVLAAACGVGLEELRAELARRFGASGLEEKRARTAAAPPEDGVEARD